MKPKSSDPPVKRKRAYELDGMRPLPFPQDPIKQLENEVLRDLNDEYRVLKLEALIEKRRRDVARMKAGGDMDIGSMPSNADFLNMAKFMADLSPEEAQRVRSAYTFLKLAEKGGGGGINMLPMLLNYAKDNPGASEDQMINYLKLMDSQLVKGLELAKAMTPPQQGEDSTLKFLSLMKDLVIEGVRNPVLQAIERSQPTPGVFDQILTNPNLWNRFKEIGMFGGSRGNAATGDFDLKIEQLRTERDLSMKKLELENQKMNLERDAQDKRTDAVLMALAPLSALFAGPINQRMSQLGKQQASAHNPASVQSSAMPMPAIPDVLIQCSCGYQGSISFDGPPPAVVNCPQCGLELNVGDLPIAGTPEESPSSVGSYDQPGSNQ